ncbi:unnamed protein product [Larinioides sclopetarius]|uniref:Tesmin/TSO1-like CXC domain-containing protein n=1 Tax=Larinioides sclopetarius TaxID=280406 RepID=A0AAV2ASP8_9ARAC
MEINKKGQPAKSTGKMVADDSLKTESCDSYCPDFSDIYDDSYEFWDFLPSKKDRNESLSREEGDHKTNFWDFLGPSSDKDQNGVSNEYVDSAVTTPNDSGVHFENECQLHSKIDVVRTISNGNNLKSPELKSTASDEEFWDFLSCNSPVVTFKELLKNCDFANNDNESGIGSFVSRCEESPFPSISEYMESEGCSTHNSSPSSVSESTKHYFGSDNRIKEFNSRRNFNTKNCDKLKESVESIDHTNYIDVLKYLQQECIVSDKEVNLTSISNDNTCLYGNPSKINSNESENCHRSLDISDKLDKINKKHSQMQEPSQGSTRKSQLNISSTSQKPFYDGKAPILSLKSSSGELRKDGNLNGMNTFKINSQQKGRIQQLINKRSTKRFKRNIPNISVTSHNTAGNSKPVLNGLHLNAANVVNFNQSNMQASLQNFKSTNSNNAEHVVKNISTSKINPLSIHATVTHCATAVNNTTASNTSATSTPLYFLMPTNSETLQNPNYSHFFLVINNNNNAQMNQPTFIQSSGVAMNTNNFKSTPIQLGPVAHSKVNPEIGIKSDNVKQNVLIMNQPKPVTSTSTSAANSSLSNIKYQTIPQVYLPYTSLINSTAATNQVNAQYLSKIPAVNSTINIPISVNNLVSSSVLPSTISNVIPSSAPITNIYSKVKSSEVAEQMTSLKLDLKPKIVQSKSKQPSLKPIKNISLGNNKYAIQQISTPVPICRSEELNNSLGFYSNLNKINESSFLEKAFVENKLAPKVNINASEAVVNNVSSFQDTLSAIPNKSVILQQNENYQRINFTSANVGTNSNFTPSVCLMGKNTNQQDKGHISTANSMNVNVVPVSGSMEITKNVTAINTIQMINTKDKQNISSIGLNPSSNLIPIKLGNSQNKSLATLQELFPPPISMVPVCVLPQAQDAKQASTSKVLILNGNGKTQTVTHKLKIDPIPNRERPISKKAKEKLKKGRLKTVRELLQERRKSGSNHSRGSNKMGKEIRVLRPVMRLSTCDVCPNKLSSIIPNSSNSETAVTSNNAEARKRPNILLLPSSSKTIKKSSFTEDKQGSSEKEQESQCFADSSVSETVEDSLSSSHASSTVDRKDSRPRHYDMSQLNVGDFRVDDDIDSCGRFRSKFKVIFNKRLFYYDFPMSRCNQYSLKSTDIWEQMARVAVPFKTVVSMSLSERTIEISINAPPSIVLGRLQARTGIIPNSTMYDTAVESDCAWGCMIRSSFHHKIILRKKQANKMKYFLCHFDDRFLNIIDVGLGESGVNNVDELSIFEGELSPTTLKQNVTKNKKHYIRRLSQWDSSENEDQKTVDEDELVLLNQMCSCRVSCRSIRCSCVKAAKSCNSVCDCNNCDNPLNILETLGMNLDFSLSDSCLFQNIYQIPKLISFLTKEVKLTCCNTFARVQDCIPGTVLCPNVDCNVPLEFSWCKKVVCYPERNPRNHCSFCGQCCFSNGRHCLVIIADSDSFRAETWMPILFYLLRQRWPSDLQPMLCGNTESSLLSHLSRKDVYSHSKGYGKKLL